LARASRTQADIAQLAERDHAMVEASGSSPGIRSRHLMAGVLRHNGHACAPQSAGAARMCAAGTPVSCSESALWRKLPPSRWSTTAMRFHDTNNKPSSSSRFEGGNRPQRLGGTGTRHRNLHGGVAQLEERLPCTQQVAGSMPVTSTIIVCSSASLTQWPECRPV
jgi:hypothetical protein